MQFARIQVVLSRSTLTHTECCLFVTRLAIASVPGKQRSEHPITSPHPLLTAQALVVMGIEPSGGGAACRTAGAASPRSDHASLRRVMNRTQIKGDARVGRGALS
jgi:hypothetical protein